MDNDPLEDEFPLEHKTCRFSASDIGISWYIYSFVFPKILVFFNTFFNIFKLMVTWSTSPLLGHIHTWGFPQEYLDLDQHQRQNRLDVSEKPVTHLKPLAGALLKQPWWLGFPLFRNPRIIGLQGCCTFTVSFVLHDIIWYHMICYDICIRY